MFWKTVFWNGSKIQPPLQNTVFQSTVFLSRHCPISHMPNYPPWPQTPRPPAGARGVGAGGDNGVYGPRLRDIGQYHDNKMCFEMKAIFWYLSKHCLSKHRPEQVAFKEQKSRTTLPKSGKAGIFDIIWQYRLIQHMECVRRESNRMLSFGSE